jgi:ribosome maturation factor RimP
VDVEALVRPVVESDGLELVDVALGKESGRRVLRVTVDREGGLDLDTIALTSQKIARRLDLEGYAPGPYALEVSSPGLERPLKSPQDFQRRVGEKVKVKVAGASHLGTLRAADDRKVTVASDEGETEIAYAEILSARTVFEWGGGK